MSLQSLIDKKKYSTILYGTTLRNDLHIKTSKYNSNTFEKDMSIYHDSAQERFKRNASQISKIISMIRCQKIIPEMLEFQVGNTFYPSYILNGHYQHFTQLINNIIDSHYESHQKLGPLLEDCRNFMKIGAIFKQSINLSFRKPSNKIQLINGTISMPQGEYFYSFKTSIHLHVCCVVLKIQNKLCYAFVKLRDETGALFNNIQTKDLGATISPDYMNVGYRLHDVKPFYVYYGQSSKIYRNISSQQARAQFGYSLRDLMKSLNITTKYTSMRRQFKTIDESKAQRPILQYQAVGSRIIDGFSELFALSYLHQRTLNMPIVRSFLKPYMPYFHQIILDRIIQLRECCGGYGYMQISGHPSLIQRVLIRSSQPASTMIPEIPELMKRVHYFTSDPSLYPKYMKTISSTECQTKDVLGLFCIVCIRMRQNRVQFSQKIYTRQFFMQSCYQVMYSIISQYPILEAGKSYPIEQLLIYSMLKYIIRFSKYIDWSFCQISKEKYIQSIFNLKNEKLKYLANHISQFNQMLEITHQGNIILGKSDSEQFYSQVLETAKSNRRNSEEYRKFIQQPMIKLLKEQRAKL